MLRGLLRAEGVDSDMEEMLFDDASPLKQAMDKLMAAGVVIGDPVTVREDLGVVQPRVQAVLKYVYPALLFRFASAAAAGHALP